jgi:uncharacterized protein
MRWLDTNILVRYLTGDDPVKAAACLVLLQRLDSGEEEVEMSEAIMSEVVYVLSSRSHYSLTHEDIRARLVPVISLRGLRLPNKAIYRRALDIFVDVPALDFEDALNVAYMQTKGITELYSYDRGFDRVSGITRIEP